MLSKTINRYLSTIGNTIASKTTLLKDVFLRSLKTHHKTLMGSRYEENAKGLIRGDVFMTLHNTQTGEVTKWERRNLIVRDASILIARLLGDNAEPPFGIYALAMGTGDSGWDPMNPPAATSTQRSLYSEIARKTFSSVMFIDANGLPSAIPTNVIDFTATFTESEAVGPLVEMGLIGGNISTNLAVKNPVTPSNGPYDASVDLTTRETLVNTLHFAVINKPPVSTFTITWRITC